MKIAYIDTIAGISGDMTLGAFVSAGVAFEELVQELNLLDINSFELQARNIERNGIAAVKIDVVTQEQEDRHRHLKEIEAIIDNSKLTENVKINSKKIFREIAVAEAKVHNTTIDKVHFHEVGAIDSLIDIIGTAICLEKLKIEAIYSSPVKIGCSGITKSQHGNLPVPTPATIEILKDYPIVLTDVPYELTTPTGAAIIKALSLGVLTTEKINISSVGYGSGGREIEQVPNLLRIMIGEIEQPYLADDIVSIETNIDDMNPEILPHVIEILITSGAKDAYITPIIMKKGRPAFLLSVLAERTKIEDMIDILFRETTTLGVRIQPVERKKLNRNYKIVQTSLGKITAKEINYAEKIQLRVEYEECKRIATEKNIPLIDVYNILEAELKSKD